MIDHTDILRPSYTEASIGSSRKRCNRSARDLTPGGTSEGLAGFLQVRQGDEARQFDLKLYGGQVVLPMVGEACNVDITFAGTNGAGPLDRLL